MYKTLIVGILLTQAQAKIHQPKNYESLGACEKQEILWENASTTQYEKLPSFKKVGPWEVIKMMHQGVSEKAYKKSDFSPKGWKKYLHRRAVMAKVKIKPLESPYTGIFEGADCALLRLSLTYKPNQKKDKAFAPGLALKVLRDGVDSANVSALYTLQGQDFDYNFFKNPLSNIVPVGKGIELKAVSYIFSKVTDYPEELEIKDMALKNAKGNVVQSVVSPRQIFFVPNENISTPSKAHDVRESIMKIKEGTLLYKIYAAPQKLNDFDYSNYKIEDIKKFVAQSTPIGEIISTSDFIASSFGDTGIFFRHEVVK